MAGLLSGLDSLGLGGLENMNIFEKDQSAGSNEARKESQKALEKDLLYDRSYECPVCSNKFTVKTIRVGKTKLLSTDMDLRPKYENIDLVKYDVVLCPRCGYAALTRYYQQLMDSQIKLIKQNISTKVTLRNYDNDTYSYEEAIERYKLALVCAIVKRAKDSEKAYLCLKSAWLLRGYQEELAADPTSSAEQYQKLQEEEHNYLTNAFDGFIEARKKEPFPMCGMDETTVDYLLCVLAFQFRKFDVASRMIAAILTSPTANSRMKDKTRELKAIIVEEIKRSKKLS
ncbi:MAG: DUF2225 domain-containing protein [Lachnospiraceae bacterium]|jgi:uncharacterized protein (DUF2225 family)|nr:DUF2225 domain-containing protein [Lachnospiraceae bacterium]